MNFKKVASFIALTFIWSWTLWILGLQHLEDGITAESIDTFLIYFFAGVYGPSLSSIIITLLFDGFSNTWKLCKKLFMFKAAWWIYVLILVLPLVFVAIGLLLYQWFFGSVGDFKFAAVAFIPIVLWSGFYAGPLGEELGWRGFLLAEFQTQFSNLKSAIVIGIIWFCWHIPLFWAPFGTLVSGKSLHLFPILTYLVLLVGLSIIITWMVVHSRGSVWIAILFHLSINAGLLLLFFPEIGPNFKTIHLLSTAGVWIFAGYLIYQRGLNLPLR
ncbi:CPBP family intramembrane glutamic endopeptidase [Nonlabens marinus]|uniref:CAAX prenyl protease 2/Lysostaphin resistance protein A-like domain-containing protein n=1 Tax=Nonlabens marinus S1-08 TaxID=1454201 RepID=W8VRG2_9FLAO|nr:CPBP family intramembrane glutamic endopeptidase [Nonlabens marinus]BAO56229.1 hypothetical protein NMS_2220 [Nonlabens marinus S1-08]